ncbi:hypothetical protein FA13DRAFT_1741301 [Coprinellus micaceus]|uniref:Uncharacterized protein n=1 Tax=Coprinellus micaceus TaxID=71717 RepID=A0A4Y7SJJ0_COPMI|nr:hypothetical protein FA13DRAFT_1741301 [Coprinellus micaceus]
MDDSQASRKAHSLKRRLNPFGPRTPRPGVDVGTKNTVEGDRTYEKQFRVPWKRGGSKKVATGTMQPEPRGVSADAVGDSVDEPPIQTTQTGVVEDPNTASSPAPSPPLKQHEHPVHSNSHPSTPLSPPPISTPACRCQTTIGEPPPMFKLNDTASQSQFLGIFQGAQQVSVENMTITIASGSGTSVVLDNPTIRYSMRKHSGQRDELRGLVWGATAFFF